MSKTILIIDDDQALVAPLKEGLESMGYRVAVAYDGLQGILQAHQTRPDLILLDFYMPGGGGGAVYERLRQSKDTAKTPIVFSTVVSVEEVKGRIRPSAHTFFLRKPVGLNQIASVIRSVLGEKPAEGKDVPFSPVPPPAAAVPSLPPLAKGGRRSAAKAASGRAHELTVRVTYADTDKMGVVYYGNYFRYFEQGRTELLRSLGARYRELEERRKIFLPVAETSCRYAAPARYDDLVVVRTWVCRLGRASVSFGYEIAAAEENGARLALGSTRHAVVDGDWKPAALPSDLRTALEPYLGAEPQV